MASENIAFYARLQKIQDLQYKREQKRMELQRQFDSHMMSDRRISRLRAARIQSYWKKICEDEQKSRARNEQLLRDFDRVEAHIATLSSRTERLRLLKDQYERQVESMYPHWKEQLEIKRAAQSNSLHGSQVLPHQQSISSESSHPYGIQQSSVLQNGTSPNVTNSFPHRQPVPAHNHIHPEHAPHSQSQYISPRSLQHSVPQPHPHVSHQTYHQVAPIPQLVHHDYQTGIMTGGTVAPQVPSHHHVTHAGYNTDTTDGRYVPGSQTGQSYVERTRAQQGQGHPQGRPQGHMEDSSSLSISSESQPSPVHQPKRGGEPQQQQQLQTSNVSGKHATMQPQTRNNKAVHSDRGSSAAESGRGGNKSAIDGKQFGPKDINADMRNLSLEKQTNRRQSLGSADKVSSAQTEPFSSEEEDEEESDNISKGHEGREMYSPELPPELPKYEDEPRGSAMDGRVNQQKDEQLGGEVRRESDARIKKPEQLPDGPRGMTEAPRVAPVEDENSGSEIDSEIDSDVSLPLSDDDGKDNRVAGNTAPMKQNPPPATSDAQDSAVLEEGGFWLLLKVVEAEIDETDSLEGIYASLPCTKTIRNEIVKTANAKTGFDRLDPRAISMVVLEELPLLVRKLPGGCLLSERLLTASSRTITELSVRSHMYSSALKFWDDILRHLVFLVRRGVMEPDVVAKKFAPLLVAADSKAVEKAVTVMADILQKAEEEEEEVTYGDESSLTETSPMTPSTPARNDPDVIQDVEPVHPKGYPAVPPLALGGMEGDTDDLVDTGRTSADSFFDNKVPLTETSAYQKMMQSTQERSAELGKSDGDGGGDDDDEDEDDSSEDEIERAARITPEPPVSQQPKKKRNVLSSLGGSLGMSLGSPDEREEEEDEERQQALPSDRTDEVSSPEKSDLASSPSPTPRGSGGYVPSAMEHSMKSTGRTDTMNRSAAFWGNESDLDNQESEMSVPMGTGTYEEEKDDFDFYD